MIRRQDLESLRAREVPLTVSVMRREDLPAILEVERLSYAHPWSADFFLEEMRLPFSRIWVAQSSLDGSWRVVGYLCRWVTAQELHILNLAVHPDWRRRSIARRLLETVIEEAREAGAVRAILEVRRNNLPALALYGRFGFSQVGTRSNYYGQGEDALVMKLSLDGESR